MKLSQNTPLNHLDRITVPVSSTSVDRYVIADHWTKDKTVLDAATGKGYGAGILLALGAESVIGIDLEQEAVEAANLRFRSPNCQFVHMDIFELTKVFEPKRFQVCTSIETFEHLPPERINEYLQQLKQVTSETIVITTPRRKTPTWGYNGGTHLYEYDQQEFRNILARNFDRFKIDGLFEHQMPGGQWGTDMITDLTHVQVMLAVVSL